MQICCIGSIYLDYAVMIEIVLNYGLTIWFRARFGTG